MELEATEAQALAELRAALAIEELPLDPEGWYTAAEVAEGKCAETTARRSLQKRLSEGTVEEMMALKTVNGLRVRVKVYRVKK